MLPQYEIEMLLGRGGMGAVYKGRQISLDRPVAIKILSNTLNEADASFAERFKNEARAMAKLTHPGIVAVYDFGQTESGLLYIVMEFVEGTDVSRMIAQQKRLHTDHAMAITAHVCDALAYAHERGIIHRDIKPANIMVGYDGVVKVADFGLAKMTKSGESGLTQSGMAMGTLHYMAPEALMLGTGVDHRADIYAVGVMLYQMLTGKLPQGMFELPSLQVPGLDPRYDGIIAKALRDDREMRYQSVLEMRQNLDSILTQPVVKVEGNAKQAPAALPTQARPQHSGGHPYRPPQAQAPAYTQKKSSLLPWVLVAVVALGLAAWFFLGYSKPVSPSASNEPPVSVSSVSSDNKTPASVTASAETVPAPASTVTPRLAPAKAAPAAATQTPLMPTAKTAEVVVPVPLTLPVGPTAWTDTKGRSITATFKAIASGNALLEIAGKVTPVPLNTLSATSQKLARDYQQQAQNALNKIVAGDPSKATKDVPFTNTLGMKFVPVPGTKVLFCIHDTRNADYSAYAASTNGADQEWKRHGVSGKEQHPVVFVNWDDATAFCAWLSQKEGRSYRLPTDEEWSYAVGIGEREAREHPNSSPKEKNWKIEGDYPWGGDYPPTAKDGNYGVVNDGYDESTSPVMQFKPNALGLFDMGGNVWQWCQDYHDPSIMTSRVLRGASWIRQIRELLRSSYRSGKAGDFRNIDIGFRCVLIVSASPAAALATPSTSTVPPASSAPSTKADPEVIRMAAAAKAFPLTDMSESSKDRARRGVSIVKVISTDIKKALQLSKEQEEWIKKRDEKLQIDCGLVRIREAANGGGSNQVVELHGEALRDVLEQFSMEQLLTWEAILGPDASQMRSYTGGPYLEAIKKKRLAGIPPGG